MVDYITYTVKLKIVGLKLIFWSSKQKMCCCVANYVEVVFSNTTFTFVV